MHRSNSSYSSFERSKKRVHTSRNPAPARIIHLKERNLVMLKKDLILRNPLRLLGRESDDILPEGGFGAVLARAGVGKTALLVQLSMNSLLQNKNVLHISLNDPVNKVSIWYQEVFNHIAHSYEIQRMDELWNNLLPHRFIMTFKVEGFSVPKLEERLTDLTEQNIFSPQMLLIDGLPFDDSIRNPLLELKSLAKKLSLHIWFTILTHRHEAPGADGLPVQLTQVADLFEAAIQMQPEGDKIHINILKGRHTNADQSSLILDPTTMLIKDR